VTRHTALRLLAVLGLLAMLLIVTVVPGSSILDLNVDTGAKVLALYVAYMAWALLTALLLGSTFFTQWDARERANA
jgi:hypothetical protein